MARLNVEIRKPVENYEDEAMGKFNIWFGNLVERRFQVLPPSSSTMRKI
jgi:hypothetical protein